ncbi:metallophosphoesterase [Rhizobium sp. TRM95111]|uniref:metallophosphoesterase n=1 Tax=Rhizobium alarense TaxID=2846851 RepID=UPI001F2C650F|nr:metallophosphoesterase [Rhizobium alarense]MCF3640217.1 metallophosphoesterase [Rhizobium alarense]
MKSILHRFRRTAFPLRSRLTLDGSAFPVYAIGDVHGCFAQLLDAERRILADLGGGDRRATVVYLGDYVDRGPHSSLVLDHLARDDHEDALRRIALCGNHDDAFLRFLRDPAGNFAWFDFGADATFRAYGIDPDPFLRSTDGKMALAERLQKTVPDRHIRFLEDLAALATVGRFVLVHAGLRPGVPLKHQEDQDLLWIREPFLSEGPCLPLTVVHGHTPVEVPVISDDRIAIDTACFATGRLTVVRLDADRARLLPHR